MSVWREEIVYVIARDQTVPQKNYLWGTGFNMFLHGLAVIINSSSDPTQSLYLWPGLLCLVILSVGRRRNSSYYSRTRKFRPVSLVVARAERPAKNIPISTGMETGMFLVYRGLV